MAYLSLTVREWEVVQKSLEHLMTYNNVKIGGQSITPAEYNHIYDKVVAAKNDDAMRIKQENDENTRHFAFGSPDEERRYCERRTQYGFPYSGPERRKH